MLHKLVIKKSPNPHHIMTVFLSAAVSVDLKFKVHYSTLSLLPQL